MRNQIKILRPVGNTITARIDKTNGTFFSSYNSSFFNSGTASLAAAIIASHKLKHGIKQPEVIVPAYGCPDLISAIIYAKAIPVLVDLEVDSPFLSIEQMNTVINENTIAIVAVRFFGISEQNKKLTEIAKQHNIILIEDSAQGFPTNDIESYWNGDFVVLSFGRGKPVNLLGGGAVLTRNAELMKLLPSPTPFKESISGKIKYNLKLFLYNQTIHPIAYGLITKVPGLNIGQTIYKPLRDIEAISSHTKLLLTSNIEAYKKYKNCQIEYNNFFRELNDNKIINLPATLSHDFEQPLLRYPILIKNKSARNRIYNLLKPYGASLMYKDPLHKISNIGNLIKKQNNFYSNATHFSQQLLTLPTHEGVDNNVIGIIKKIIKES